MKKRSIGYKRLLVGFIFLLSPDISIIDILPDFIGYLLIISGLSVLADIDDRANDAKNLAKRLLLLAFVKFALQFYLPSLEKTNLLLVTFSLAIIDVILIFPFVKELFHSIDYTATRQGIQISSKKNTEIKLLVGFFLILKDVLMVAPSVVSLFDPSETGDFGNDVWHIDFTALFNVLTVLAFFLSIVVFVFMTVKTIIYFASLAKNGDLMSRLWSNYENTVLSVPEKVISKNIKASSVLITVAPLFFIDFYIDFTEVLPSAIGFILIFAYAVFIGKKMGNPSALLALVSLAGAVVSAVAFLYRAYWYKELGAAVEYSFSGGKYTFVLGFLSSVFVFAAFLLLAKSITEIEKKYLDEKSVSKSIIISASALILAVFNFMLYAYPQKNASFVFPNILFSIFFVYIVIDRVRTVRAQILSKYKVKEY